MNTLLLALLLQAAAPQADPPPPDPEIERKSFKVAEGFEVNLFAADPLVSKPTQMNWDARGRLRISTSRLRSEMSARERSTSIDGDIWAVSVDCGSS